MSYLAIRLVFATVTIILAFKFLDSPKEKMLRREIEALQLQYDLLHKKMAAYLTDKAIYIKDAYACAHQDYRLNLRLVAEFPWAIMFAHKKQARKLRKAFSNLAAIDFFPGEAQKQADEALRDLEQRAAWAVPLLNHTRSTMPLSA